MTLRASYQEDGVDQPENMSQNYFRGWRRSEKAAIPVVLLIALISSPLLLRTISIAEVLLWLGLMTQNERDRLYRVWCKRLFRRAGRIWVAPPKKDGGGDG